MSIDEQTVKLRESMFSYEELLSAQINGKGKNYRLPSSDIDKILHPQVLAFDKAKEFLQTAELGKLYYFKTRAIFKGLKKSPDDKHYSMVYLKELGEGTVENDLFSIAYGVDTSILSVSCEDVVVSTLPEDANCLVTFYAYGYKIKNSPFSDSNIILRIRIARDIEKLFVASNFTIASGLHYITVNDTSLSSGQNIMMSLFTGGDMGNDSANVFDPIAYKIVDLFDAKAAMDKKDYRNDYTFPTIRVKYASELVFKGQTNTTISVSTSDNALTQRMDFSGRTSSIKTGDRVRVYFTIAKDPLEEWKVQAIERL
ncbi:hypothetical protein AGMMS49944_08480 [Spirochaetia bacterium]|nr:hypothetical protein AGMMS49944_08480 [Spirochaetia bacterium]